MSVDAELMARDSKILSAGWISSSCNTLQIHWAWPAG